jgi:tRNA(His) guanylyltransferase
LEGDALFREVGRFRFRGLLTRSKIVEPGSDTNAIPVLPPTSDHDANVSQEPEYARQDKERKSKNDRKPTTKVTVLHCDIIKDEFWEARPSILAG